MLKLRCVGIIAVGASILTTVGRVQAQTPGEPLGFVTTPSGLKYVITEHGTGPRPRPGQVIVTHYTGTLSGGSMFFNTHERATPSSFTLGKGRLTGFTEAFSLLRVGDKATLILPPHLAYGDRGIVLIGGRQPIPAGSTLRYEVEFLDIKSYELATVLREAIDSAGIEAALRRYERAKATNFADYAVSEDGINFAGYSYLNQGKTAEAIALFTINVEQFPKSDNVYDSLCEGYMKSGQRELAIQNCQQAIELNPRNETSAKMLAELSKGT